MAGVRDPLLAVLNWRTDRSPGKYLRFNLLGLLSFVPALCLAVFERDPGESLLDAVRTEVVAVVLAVVLLATIPPTVRRWGE